MTIEHTMTTGGNADITIKQHEDVDFLFHVHINPKQVFGTESLFELSDFVRSVAYLIDADVVEEKKPTNDELMKMIIKALEK